QVIPLLNLLKCRRVFVKIPGPAGLHVVRPKFALLPTDGGGNTEASTISSQVQRCSARQRTRRTGLVHQLVMAHFDLGLAKRPVLVERRYALNVDIPAN